MYLPIFFISMAAWLAFEIGLSLRDSRKDPSTAAEARRTIIALAIAISLAMNASGLAPMLDIHRNYNIYFYLGIALMWAGLLYRYWAVRTLGPFFSTRLIVQPGQDVITAGPYRYLRHPSYTGGLMTLCGMGVSLGNGLSLAILLGTGLVVYALRVRSEEKMLAQAFGSKYEEYKKHTWAVIPLVW